MRKKFKTLSHSAGCLSKRNTKGFFARQTTKIWHCNWICFAAQLLIVRTMTFCPCQSPLFNTKKRSENLRHCSKLLKFFVLDGPQNSSIWFGRTVLSLFSSRFFLSPQRKKNLIFVFLAWKNIVFFVFFLVCLSICQKLLITQKVPRGFEPQSLDSESRVRTVTPRDQLH